MPTILCKFEVYAAYATLREQWYGFLIVYKS